MTSRRCLRALLATALVFAIPSVFGSGNSPEHSHPHAGVPEKFPEHPAVGETASDFSLRDTEGKSMDLGEYLGRGYVVLAFGSASSSNFRKTAPELNRLVVDWERMEVKVLVVYTREAHPAALRGKAPNNYGDRVLLARQTRKDLRLGLRFVVDGWDDPVHKSYGAMPDAAFLLDPKGSIVLRQVLALPTHLDRELRRLLNVPDPAPLQGRE